MASSLLKKLSTGPVGRQRLRGARGVSRGGVVEGGQKKAKAVGGDPEADEAGNLKTRALRSGAIFW